MLCVVTYLSVKPLVVCVVTDLSVKPWLIEVNGGICCD